VHRIRQKKSLRNKIISKYFFKFILFDLYSVGNAYEKQMKKKLEVFSKCDRETASLLKFNNDCIKDLEKIKRRNRIASEASELFKNV
jgi:hypothetical protein